MVTNPGPGPPPPPCPGPLTSAHVSGGARLAGPCGAGGKEQRSKLSGRRPRQAALPALPLARPRSCPPCLAAGPSMVMADGPRHLQRGPVRVGFYDIEGTLGKGNFAVVKLGRHRITKTEVRPGARRERPRRGFGRRAAYREGRPQWWDWGDPRGRLTAGGERAWDCKDPGGAGGR